LAIAPHADTRKVVLISPASTSPKLTGAGDFIFRVIPSGSKRACGCDHRHSPLVTNVTVYGAASAQRLLSPAFADRASDIELNVPRTRRYSPVEVVRAYARRTRELDRVILSAFVLGLSTRKVGETLLSILGRPVSAATVS
jgi:hypothetical protein